MNMIIVTGRLTKDPAMRTSKKTGKMFCAMRFAIQGDYRGKNVARDTDFVDVLAFKDKGETMYKHLRKGMRVLIRGYLKVFETHDAYGQKLERIYICVNGYEMLDSHYLKEPIEDLSDSSGELLIPKEITDSLIRQVNAKDQDVPVEFAERSVDDLL